MQCRITKRTVDAAVAGTKDSFLWDVEIKGFGLKTTPAGRKVYIYQYRTGGRGAPTKRLTLGIHGKMTPHQAREQVTRIAGVGGDPATAKAAEKQAPTMVDLAKRFLTEHATKKKPRTEAEYRRLMDRLILPALGTKRVRDIGRADISRLHHELRSTPYEANRTLALLSKMFALSESWGERPDNSNPCRHVEKFKEHKREAMLSAEDFGKLADALAASGRSPYVLAAIKLLIFTGARLNEILELRWEWIDFERGEARLPDSKSGAKTLHLPPPATAILAELPRVTGNPHVIVGNVAGRRLVNVQKAWRSIRKSAGFEDLRLHDLRHAFATVAASSGMGLPTIGRMLGHNTAVATHRYSHLQSDAVKAAAASVANRIEAAMKSATRDDNQAVVVRLGSVQ